MTIQQEAEQWLAVCDQCGENLWLDADTEDRAEVVLELVKLGWAHAMPDRHRFKGMNTYTEVYESDRCPDCAADELRPKPLIRNQPLRRVFKRDAFDNDPCDDWPKVAIYQADGLRTCGHARGSVPCPACQYEAHTGRAYRSALG